MSEDDLKSFIEDVIKDMVSAGELEAGHEGMENEEGAEEGEEEMGGEEEELDEEINLDELLAEEDDVTEGNAYSKKAKDPSPKSKNAIFSKGKDEYVTDKTEVDDAPYSKKKAEKLSFHEEELEEGSFTGTLKGIAKAFNLFKQPAETAKEMEAKLKADPKLKNDEDFMAQLNILKKMAVLAGASSSFTSGGGSGEKQARFESKELEEAMKTIKTLQSELNEINLLNAKLLYTNKIFRNKSLTESQKIKVLTAFDKATSKKEVELVYETLQEGLKVSTTKAPIKESLGSASKVLGSVSNKPIIEVDNQFARWQQLAGIKK